MDEARPVTLIKRYGGGRLYDGDLASYVTLRDLRRSLIVGRRFRICDAASGEDVTDEVLSGHEPAAD